jgi:hypothetical protein
VTAAQEAELVVETLELESQHKADEVVQPADRGTTDLDIVVDTAAVNSSVVGDTQPATLVAGRALWVVEHMAVDHTAGCTLAVQVVVLSDHSL